jgi:proton-translocating NADH-quinone oxidoreductase chain M
MLLSQSIFNNSFSNLLVSLNLIPIIASLAILSFPAWKVNYIRSTALIASLITFLLSLVIWVLFDPSSADFQFRYELSSPSIGGLFNFSFGFGVDGINIWLILLTTFLTPICILVGWLMPATVEIKGPEYLKIYCLIFLIMEVILIIAFTARDLLIFYLFFEAVLIPMFLLVGIFGSKPRNIRAAYKMFIYTLVGSFPMLAGILMVYFQCGSTDWDILSTSHFSASRQIILWMLWFISFGVKTPLVPFHGWLPETHSNAPTAGSIILAGILLKLGTYGFMRWSLGLFPLACIYFSPLMYIICLIGIIYVSLITLRQVDIKKIIAYSSIAHMGCCLLGMFAFNMIGLEGSLLMMIGHGIVSPGLFLCVGILYDRYKTRVVYYYGGLAQTMPLFSTALLILTMANISLPVLSPTFAAELLIFTSIFIVNKLVAILAATTMVLTGAYALFLYCRICFGNLKYVYIQKYCDLSRREFAALIPFVILSVLVGVCPSLILNTCHTSIAYILLMPNF